jgi:hypothetical protein
VPHLYLTQLRRKWKTDATPFPNTPLNRFYHFRNIVDASYKDGDSPKDDTLCSWGSFDLSKEPVVLAQPDLGRRYFTVQLAETCIPIISDTSANAQPDRRLEPSLSQILTGIQKPDDVRENTLRWCSGEPSSKVLMTLRRSTNCSTNIV